MGFTFLLLLMMPLVSHSQDKGITFDLKAVTNVTPGHHFENPGYGQLFVAETDLSTHGGYEANYRSFRSQKPQPIILGVWQEAQAFRDYLLTCNIDVPADVLAMKMGLDKIFAAKSQSEVDEIAEELGGKLSYQNSVAFAAMVGNVLGGIYDYARLDLKSDASKGVVSMMDMVNAKQNGTKAGVCRDMHQAMAQLLVKMGLKSSFVIAAQDVGGAHAVTITQDPNDPKRSCMINYGSVSCETSSMTTNHLLLDTTIPSIGTEYKIYSAEGRPLTTRPSGLGTILNDFASRDPSLLDPMTVSQSSYASATIARGEKVSLTLSQGRSSDEDTVTGLTAKLSDLSKHHPSVIDITLYNSQRDTSQEGRLDVNGLYIDGIQTLTATPLKGAVAGGEGSVEVYGRIGVQTNLAMASLSQSKKKDEFSMSVDVTAATGTTGTYVSDDGKTKVRANVEARFASDTGDIRDSNSMVFDLRNVAGSVIVREEFAHGVSSFAQGKVVVRDGLGSQARAELGLTLTDHAGGTTSMSVAREGQVSGPVLAFVPVSLTTYRFDLGYEDAKKKKSLSAGVYCTTQNRRDCGTRVTGRLKFN